MNNLYVISGVTGMTGSELARQLLKTGHSVIGFDNFLLIFLDICFFNSSFSHIFFALLLAFLWATVIAFFIFVFVS